MAKKLNIPKTNVSSKADLITIMQNGVQKSITKASLLKHLEDSLTNVSAEISSVKKQLSKKTINKDNPSFSKAISAGEPLKDKDLTTKSYVDNSIFNVVKNDGSTKLLKTLSYKNSPNSFRDNDVVTKKFVDNSLKATLKAVKKSSGLNGYPPSSAGDSFVIQTNLDVFATNGPEVQVGDLILCIEDSSGGTHGEVGHQFAIVNTNVVFAKENTAGILKVASEEEVVNLDSEDSAITPYKLKRALETNSEYNRIFVTTPTYTLSEEDRGIVGVNSLNNQVVLTLPTIGRLTNPKLVKYTIKDESNTASKNTITIKTSGGNTIQKARSFILSTNGESVKIYNDNDNNWFLESNVSSGTSGTGGIKTFAAIDLTNGERPTTAGSYESVMSIDVDLREYPLGTGFKVISHCFAAANGNTKTIAIGIGGTQVQASSGTGTTAPNAMFVHHEVTVLHTDTPTSMAFGFVLVGGDMAADGTSTSLTNTLALEWNSKITVSVDVNVNPVTDVNVYALQVIPLK
tara:strand:- start:1557 stop:3104 length:1548 start_codon:yes stop_codon:yes gene_type:complete